MGGDGLTLGFPFLRQPHPTSLRGHVSSLLRRSRMRNPSKACSRDEGARLRATLLILNERPHHVCLRINLHQFMDIDAKIGYSITYVRASSAAPPRGFQGGAIYAG